MIAKIKALFKPSFRLSIYMRSGNVIELSHVTDWEVENRENEIVGLSVAQKKKGAKLVINSIALSQIEAVVRHY